ncbi:FxsA family protein [Geobacter sulfurreducens]|uniref:Cytoplasmic membrane protein FxsA n=1 Tax=Geobacter sulfurreducens (strain ATCC 51573 / DSM 12127 / PCA) TaxID=243231 RepID=Q74F04_GEOSL|nr:FxsA family protein [Geobacter sulfurreducens]AAR34135.1 cytoplasmic membrane protein FxsA [Geobacter sulfurreducens PCA]ADI83648.1 cytoplasmic membrane protein FxsA [Geobacter sulfurreducens KN400]AJY70548.1 exlusion protein FxsA [Geobacter sulfurreducens]QVW36054.1 FxsA family protein [Geobacter sulfurreducens]UAC04869.1 FxsA family protein [Geobacter sulfurreducens]
MLLRLFLIFSVVPIIELYLLIRVGKLIGALPTVALLLVVSLAGAWLVRSQGFVILRRIQDELAMGRLPAAGLLDGALVLLGGLLLLTPGFFSDVVGLFFIIPPTRAVIKQFLGLWLQNRLARGQFVIRRF